MSYQYKRADAQVVVCDLCGDFSWLSDRNWRKMPQSTPGRLIHLCQSCQRHAMWCGAHQQYHQANAFHRCACADCGGLFTSTVQDMLTRCPSCRRAAGEVPMRATPSPAERPRSLIEKLFSLRTIHRSCGD